MLQNSTLTGYVVLALLTALVVSVLLTPAVKSFAYKVGAVDVPKDARRMHKVPIPRLGGLAIFMGFMVSILLFANVMEDRQMRGILLAWWTTLRLCRRSSSSWCRSWPPSCR